MYISLLNGSLQFILTADLFLLQNVKSPRSVQFDGVCFGETEEGKNLCFSFYN
jgi:hypothetical protein